MSFTYNNLVPATNNNPSADQPLMLTNTQSINSIVAVDHIGFNAGNGGYHTVIHQGNQGADPAPIVAPFPINQTYSKAYTPDTTGGAADTELFIISALGQISQLTGYNTVSTTDGWQWIGGILLQWGKTTTVSSGSFASGSASGTVTFKDRVAGAIPFPTNCFIVLTDLFWTTAGGAPNGSGTVNVNITTLSNLSFAWQFNSNSSKYTGFHWFAVGN